MREKGQTEVAKTLETPVFSRGIEILTEKTYLFQFSKLEIVIQKVFNNPVELLFYQSKVKCYLFAYKWQPFTWSLTIPIACI